MTKTGLSHKCPDGTHSRLNREGAKGQLEGTQISCPRCGYTVEAAALMAEYERVRPAIVAALS